ncbi:MAG: polysulfide reductase NrfD [candidate division KSB1 bacterium]|nr:polysulfide reductase NrfD [candidate division KSB1 bacterium]
MEKLFALLNHALQNVTGFIYPNEVELHWNILIVIYPYITGLVAGAFILASLERVFNVKEVQPTYRLSLLTALAFLIVAPLPLQAHLARPERGIEMFLTPHLQSAMAMFGFVYLWYLLAVLLLEIWFDYRDNIVHWSRSETGIKKIIYKILTLGTTDVSEQSIALDRKIGKFITIIGIPSAFLLHGYVGFIFGSVKANPWWSSVLMPIVFLFSAIVSGIAMVLLLYMISNFLRGKKNNMPCLDKLGSYLLYVMLIDFSLESLDFIQRLYEAEESIKILGEMVRSKLFISLIVSQVIIGTVLPILSLAFVKLIRTAEAFRRAIYFITAILVQIGIFSIRWNVVIGGQLFSKSFRGLTVYKVELFGIEGLLMAIGLLVLPFVILWILVKILPPWSESDLSIDPLRNQR